MIYQLPTGKFIYITVEQYLSLSDEELAMLALQNIGEYARSPWVGSAIKNPVKKRKEDVESHDTSIDFTEDSDELPGEKPILTDEAVMEEFPELPDEDDKLD